MKNYNKYGNVAIEAVRKIEFGKDPVNAWEEAALELFGNNSAAKKGCPKSTFLGLCEDGFVKGVKRGVYTGSKKNKAYGIKAVKTLIESNKNYSVKSLWEKINVYGIRHNSQMDVVIALWENNLIIGSSKNGFWKSILSFLHG